MLLLMAGLVAVAYFAIALSPISGSIGRRSPAAASWFSPPLLNFSHTYHEGHVLQFRVGMNRNELFEQLRRSYAGKADLIVGCRVTTADSVMPVTTDLDIEAVYGGGDRVCTRLDGRRLGADFQFHGDRVTSISVWFVRHEGT
jgi:hypothetical protein